MSHPVSTTHRLKMFFINTPANVKGRTELFASATYLTTHNYSSLWRKQYNLVEPLKSWGMCKNGSSVTCKQLGFKIQGVAIKLQPTMQGIAVLSSCGHFQWRSGKYLVYLKRWYTAARKKFPKSTPQCILTSFGQESAQRSLWRNRTAGRAAGTKSSWW